MVNADARGYEVASALMRRADEAGLDLFVGAPDHPYSRDLLGTLSFIAALVPQTEWVRPFTDVADLHGHEHPGHERRRCEECFHNLSASKHHLGAPRQWTGPCSVVAGPIHVGVLVVALAPSLGWLLARTYRALERSGIGQRGGREIERGVAVPRLHGSAL